MCVCVSSSVDGIVAATKGQPARWCSPPGVLRRLECGDVAGGYAWMVVVVVEPIMRSSRGEGKRDETGHSDGTNTINIAIDSIADLGVGEGGDGGEGVVGVGWRVGEKTGTGREILYEGEKQLSWSVPHQPIPPPPNPRFHEGSGHVQPQK